MASGEETILDHFPSLSYDLLSSDERTLIRSADQNLDIRPTSGGEWKSVGSIAEDFAMGLGQFNITPDGKWLVYHDVDSKGKDCLSRVAITGGPPERLGNFPTQNARMGPPLASGSLEISPDGGKVIVSNDDPFTGYELWQLENFVPPAPKP
jgi:hypothetical protein